MHVLHCCQWPMAAVAIVVCLFTDCEPSVPAGLPGIQVAAVAHRSPGASLQEEESATANPASSPLRWYRGNLHTHSLWSDGDDFPEMITNWYAQRGYHFLAMTDHNVLARGERWMDAAKIEERGGKECVEKYRNEFGSTMVRTREHEGKTQYRLTPLEEYRTLFEKSGEFLLIEGEEISDSVGGLPVHLNATNLAELLQPVGGATVREAIDNNLRMAAEQAERFGQPVLVHINHPNFGWAVSAEDLAGAMRARFVEVYNGHNAVNHNGDESRPSVERLWDIANTLRIDKLDLPPLYGLGTDDSHYYHGRPGSHPGRGWIMVRAKELTVEALIAAMYRGDFHASSGVMLNEVTFDAERRELRIEIAGEDGVTYETHFVGTRRDYQTRSGDNATPPGDLPSVGEVLAMDASLNPVYQFRGDELYVRAVITSTRPHPDPSFEGQTEQAWTQPVGWEH